MSLFQEGGLVGLLLILGDGKGQRVCAFLDARRGGSDIVVCVLAGEKT